MKKVGVIFGGQSEEHYVSIISGLYISHNIDTSKYQISNIYIDKQGNWYECIDIEDTLEIGETPKNLKEIINVIKYLKELDILFPVLHGVNGEDGTIQGLFELLKKPYVGSKVLGSSISMDKAYTKIIFEKAGINQVKHIYIKKYNDKYIYVKSNFDEELCDIKEIVNLAEKEINYPMFIKPSNSGSSIGITKASNSDELIASIKEAEKYDRKILIEEGLDIRELEVAVLGNEDIKTSFVGEIISADDFYDYDSKYKNSNSKTINHANISKDIEEKIQTQAIKAFKAVDGKGLARVDFFLDKNDNIYLNEINTIPGFTSISMYPKLFEESGIPIKELTSALLDLAVEK